MRTMRTSTELLRWQCVRADGDSWWHCSPADKEDLAEMLKRDKSVMKKTQVVITEWHDVWVTNLNGKAWIMKLQMPPYNPSETAVLLRAAAPSHDWRRHLVSNQQFSPTKLFQSALKARFVFVILVTMTMSQSFSYCLFKLIILFHFGE